MNGSSLKKTEIYNRSRLNEAAQALKMGDLVAFPTETVFGLGAIANNETAVSNVFKTKGRPSDNPLIVHVHKKESVATYVKEINSVADQLMDIFWPGPLTIIFPAKEGVFAPSVTANLDTVAMRMPNQLETLLLIEMAGFPLVGPSANISSKPSPTKVEHVLHDFSGKIAGIVNNYSELTDIGIESTVVLPTENSITILRPGAVTKEMLETAVAVEVCEKTTNEQMKDETVLSPGVKYKHYSPKQAVYMVNEERSLDQWIKLIKDSPYKIGLLAQENLLEALVDQINVVSSYSLGKQEHISDINQYLFAGLRYLEGSGCEVIYAQAFNDREETHAYMNRLTKAASNML